MCCTRLSQKLVVAHFKVFLPKIISLIESTFVPARMITNNVLVAYECFRTINNKRKHKEVSCAVKLAMHKVYDRVEWSFLKGIMLKLGFHESCFFYDPMCLNFQISGSC